MDPYAGINFVLAILSLQNLFVFLRLSLNNDYVITVNLKTTTYNLLNQMGANSQWLTLYYSSALKKKIALVSHDRI